MGAWAGIWVCCCSLHVVQCVWAECHACDRGKKAAARTHVLIPLLSSLVLFLHAGGVISRGQMRAITAERESRFLPLHRQVKQCYLAVDMKWIHVEMVECCMSLE